MNQIPDLLNPSSWDPQTITQTIIDLRNRIRDLERASTPAADAISTSLPSGLVIRQKIVKADASGSVSPTSGVPLIFLTIPFTSQGGPVILRSNAYLIESKSGAAVVSHASYLEIDGVLPPAPDSYSEGGFGLPSSGAGGAVTGPLSAMSYWPSLASGHHSATLTVLFNASLTLSIFAYGSMELEEYAAVG